jgi:hypothetical protein
MIDLICLMLMGSAESAPEDTEYPFFQMLQWATHDLAEDTVMAYDLERAKTVVLGIPADEAALISTDTKQVSSLKCYEGSEREIWEEWAESLLQREDLRELRFKLVPKRLSEQEFWQKYFARAKHLLLETIQGT